MDDRYRIYAVMYFIAENKLNGDYKVFKAAWCFTDRPIKRKHMKRLHNMIQNMMGEEWEVSPCTSRTYLDTPLRLRNELDSRKIDECLRRNEHGKN